MKKREEGSIILLNAAGTFFFFLQCCLVLKGPQRSLALGRNSFRVTPCVVLREISKQRETLLSIISESKHFSRS